MMERFALRNALGPRWCSGKELFMTPSAFTNPGWKVTSMFETTSGVGLKPTTLSVSIPMLFALNLAAPLPPTPPLVMAGKRMISRCAAAPVRRRQVWDFGSTTRVERVFCPLQ